MPFLVVENLRKTFLAPSGRKTLALDGVSFSLSKGEILTIVGHNGSGKTTLLNCIRQNVLWDSGDIQLDGGSLRDSSLPVVSVFQDVAMGVVGSMTALENLSLVFSRRANYIWSFPLRHFHSRTLDFLEQAGLSERFRAFEDTPLQELSGGQRQQVGIVMAMMRNPSVLLLDEFVANLDPQVKNDILEWTLLWIKEHQITTLMVSHDLQLAESWGDRVLEISGGKCVRFEMAKKTSVAGAWK